MGATVLGGTRAVSIGRGPRSRRDNSFADWAPTFPRPRSASAPTSACWWRAFTPSRRLLDVLEIPYTLQAWEPQYCLAGYTDEGIDAPSPALPSNDTFRPVVARDVATRIDDDTVTLALRQLVEPWTASSDGHAELACVEGDADDAINALGVRAHGWRPCIPSRHWLARVGGASGGAPGVDGAERWDASARGGCARRVRLTDDWPIATDELGRMVGSLRWWWWDAAEPRVAGSCRSRWPILPRLRVGDQRPRRSLTPKEGRT